MNTPFFSFGNIAIPGSVELKVNGRTAPNYCYSVTEDGVLKINRRGRMLIWVLSKLPLRLWW